MTDICKTANRYSRALSKLRIKVVNFLEIVENRSCRGCNEKDKEWRE